MKKVTLANQSVEELKNALKDLLLLSFKLRIQKSIQQLTDSNQLKVVRRNIARYKTELAIRGEAV
jgi:large subunit ribosomal protein L29